jgi:hypothetical protein
MSVIFMTFPAQMEHRSNVHQMRGEFDRNHLQFHVFRVGGVEAMSFLFAGDVGSAPNFLGSDFSVSLQELAKPCPEGDRIKRAIDRAARAAGLSYWRAFDIWYGKARRIDAHEAAQINEALRIKREKAVASEYQELKTRLAKLESALLVQGNPNVHRETHHSAQLARPRSR